MKLSKLILGLLVAATAVAGQEAWAHGSRTRVGVYVGVPVGVSVWGPGWYPPLYSPYYYPPQVVVMPPSQPPVYVEQAPSAEVPAQHYWYYCGSAKGYYPYVRECPEGWQQVLPQPEK